MSRTSAGLVTTRRLWASVPSSSARMRSRPGVADRHMSWNIWCACETTSALVDQTISRGVAAPEETCSSIAESGVAEYSPLLSRKETLLSSICLTSMPASMTCL